MKLLNLKFLFISLFVLQTSSIYASEFAIINVNDLIQFKVKTAIDLKKKKIGLMNVKNLNDHNGMLFLYKNPQKVTMWMYKTLIPLDIIFIDDKGIVLSIKEGVPESRILISSEKKISAVLEIEKGCANYFKIQKGSNLKWKLVNFSEIKEFRYYDCLDGKEKIE